MTRIRQVGVDGSSQGEDVWMTLRVEPTKKRQTISPLQSRLGCGQKRRKLFCQVAFENLRTEK